MLHYCDGVWDIIETIINSEEVTYYHHEDDSSVPEGFIRFTHVEDGVVSFEDDILGDDTEIDGITWDVEYDDGVTYIELLVPEDHPDLPTLS